MATPAHQKSSSHAPTAISGMPNAADDHRFDGSTAQEYKPNT
jgi:hypothetical protein